MREAGSRARAWTAGPSVQPKESPLLPDLSVTNDPWLACLWRERLAGRLSVRELRVLVALYSFRATAAAGWPTQSQLARQAGYSLDACRTALLRARLLGLLATSRPKAGESYVYRFLLPDGESHQ